MHPLTPPYHSQLGQIPPPHPPHNPINHQQRPRPRAHLLVPIHTPPRVHRRQATHQLELSQIKDRGVPDIREGPQMKVPEGLGDLLVGDARELGGRGGGGGGGLVRGDVPAVLFAGEGELVELFADVFALLGGDLGGLGEW